jgi:5'-nucleotidase
MEAPLILITNDDGIEAAGLWAAAAALAPLGELLIVAPEVQWSGAGRSMPHSVTGRITQIDHPIKGATLTAYAADASPALAIVHAMLELAPRPPALVVSGINFGENVSTQITISGTVGAALEGAAYNIPALAVSLEMLPAYHLTGREDADFTASMAFTFQFARLILQQALPYDVDLFNLNIPWDATPQTPWQMTRLAHLNYFISEAPDRQNGPGRPGYRELKDLTTVETGTDVWALRVARAVSLTPVSLDCTSRADLGALEERLRRR